MRDERFTSDAEFVQTFIDRAPGVEELALPAEIEARWRKLNNVFLGLVVLASHRLFETPEWRSTVKALSEEMSAVYAWFKPIKTSAETLEDGPEKKAIANFDQEFRLRAVLFHKLGVPLNFHY